MKTNANPILELTIEFFLQIIEFCEELELRKKFVLSRQLMKSGTSIGANVHEAQSPESKLDFIHKLKIADKEAKETEYWLLLCNKSSHYPNSQNLLDKLKVIQKLLTSIIYSSRKSLKKSVRMSNQ